LNLSFISISGKLKEFPKTGVQAYARTPVFGLFLLFRDLLFIITRYFVPVDFTGRHTGSKLFVIVASVNLRGDIAPERE
jgi:hypothetical protein